MPGLLWMFVMLGAFYMLLVRPQRRQVAAHAELMRTLSVGDEVLTAGGIYGRILSMDTDTVEFEVAEGVVVKMARTAVSRRLAPHPSDLPELES